MKCLVIQVIDIMTIAAIVIIYNPGTADNITCDTKIWNMKHLQELIYLVT